MAVSMDISLSKMKKVFHDNDLSEADVLTLEGMGAELSATFYTVSLTVKGKEHHFKTPIAVPTLFGGNKAGLSSYGDALKCLHEWVKSVAAVHWDTGYYEAPKPLKVEPSETADKPKFKAKAAPVPEVLPLRDAQALGQAVKGTTAGSVYRVVAVGPNVRAAARNAGDGTVSLRIETQVPVSSNEHGRLVAAGFAKAGEHYSMHIALGGFPSERLVGAVLMELGELFTDTAKTLKEVNL